MEPLETPSWIGSGGGSVRLAAGQTAGHVAVYNVRESFFQAQLLSSFGVWLGTAAGDTSIGACGEASYDAKSEPRPYVFDCSRASPHPPPPTSSPYADTPRAKGRAGAEAEGMWADGSGK